MFIEKIELENWKCFKNKKILSFKQHELITMKNGTGKTSIFQAIIYAIWGKTPIGFNLNSIRNDEKLPCRVKIWFTMKFKSSEKIHHSGINNESHCTIERIFGGNNLCELIIDDTLIAESSRAIDSYMNKFLNYKIVNQLWTMSLIDSDMLRSDFFTKSVLEDMLIEPLSLLNHFKSKNYSLNREISRFEAINEKILDPKAIESKMEDIKKNLQKQVNGDINKAKLASEAFEKIEKSKSKIINLEKEGKDYNFANEYKRLYRSKDKIKKDFELESSKISSKLSYFNLNELNKIIKFSEESGKCLICGEAINSNHIENLRNEMKLSGRSEEKLTSLKQQLDLLDSSDIETVNFIIDYYNNMNIYNRCKNFKEIIENYNENNDKLWNDFNKLQKDYSIALKQQEELKNIQNMRSIVEENKKKIVLINNYIDNFTNYYTNEFMNKASGYLSSINSRYKQICLYEKNFYVIVEDEELALHMLPVARLSNGEKTMCALSLLFSIHNLLVPELPLLFDETFSALDRENLYQIQQFLSKQKSQIFIITHDKQWQEF